jgi:hypothetical protein
MTHFIEVTNAETGRKELLNTNTIESVYEHESKTVIALTKETGFSSMGIKESYQDIKKVLLQPS